MDNGLRLKTDTLKNIKGIVFRDNGNIVITLARELIEPLDRIPFPFRSKDSVPIFTSAVVLINVPLQQLRLLEKTRFLALNTLSVRLSMY